MSTVIEIHNSHAAGPSIRLHAKDNVVIARADVGIGVVLPQEGIKTRAQVQAGADPNARGEQDVNLLQIAMLAQANQMPQTVMALLKG